MIAPSNSDLLWIKIRLAEPRLFAATDIFWHSPDLRTLLPHFLVQAHLLMCNGLTMMTVARDRALALPEDPVATELSAYLAVHLKEESGHEAWLLDDIRTLGLSEDEVLQARPTRSLVDLIGAQYFWMTHVHPVAIMGYLILLEGYAPLVPQLEDIRQRTGAPATAFRCLKAHAEDDPAHLADLNRALDGMDLNASQAKAVALCAFAAIDGLASMFEELASTHLPPDVHLVQGPTERAHAAA